MSRLNKWQKYWKQLAGISLAVICGLSVWSYSVSSIKAVNLENDCSLTVDLGSIEDLQKEDVVIDLYKVADAIADSNYDTYKYSVLSDYEALKAPLENNNTLTQTSYKALAQQAAEITLLENKDIQKAVSNHSTASPITGLSSGLYLLVARGNGLEDYVKEIETDEDSKKVVTIALSKTQEYSFDPMLIALPTKEANEAGEIDTSNPGEWIYNLDITLKSELGPRFGDLEIVKTLNTYEGTQPASFVFRIDVWKDTSKKDLIYSNVETITFTNSGQNSVRIDGIIPVGSYVEVTEIYTGSKYELVGDDYMQKIDFMDGDKLNSVNFENDYDETKTGGTAITNRFELDENGEYIWSQQ